MTEQVPKTEVTVQAAVGSAWTTMQHPAPAGADMPLISGVVAA